MMKVSSYVFWVGLVAALVIAGCGSEGESTGKQSEAARATSDAAPSLETNTVNHFTWPDAPSDIAVLEIRDRGTIKIGLYAQLAPQTVAHFKQLAAEGIYDQTQFHRVIKDFMIQGGDPRTKPKDDPSQRLRDFGDLGVADEFNAAHHERGVVSMANRGRPNTAASQFFIVHQDTPDLDGSYTAFGRVLEGMDVVDAIAALEIDQYGRFGSKNRPLDPPVVLRVRFETSQ